MVLNGLDHLNDSIVTLQTDDGSYTNNGKQWTEIISTWIMNNYEKHPAAQLYQEPHK
jgi:hypothetical protein